MAATSTETRKRANPREGDPRVIDYPRSVDDLEKWQSGSVVGSEFSSATKTHVVNLPIATRGVEFTISGIKSGVPYMQVFPYGGSGNTFRYRDSRGTLNEATSVTLNDGSMVTLRCFVDGIWDVSGGISRIRFDTSNVIIELNGASYLHVGTNGGSFWLPRNALDCDDALNPSGFPIVGGRLLARDSRAGADNALVTGIKAKSRFNHGRAFSGGHHGYETGFINEYGSCQGEEVHLRAFTDGATTPSADLSDYADVAVLLLEADRTYLFKMMLIAKRLDKRAEHAMWEGEFGVEGNASPGSLVLFNNKTIRLKSADAVNWDYALSIGTGGGGGQLKITVTGDTSMNVGWSAVIWVAEVFGYKAPA